MLTINTLGWITGITHHPSPNFNQRPDTNIDLLVIHNISLPPGEFGGNDIIALFQNKLDTSKYPFYKDLEGLTVSAHFLIHRTGEIIQFVSIYDRAWHAGLSSFQGKENCNDFSIGIELEGTDITPFEPEQYHALANLTKAIQQACPRITQERITGHSNIAPGRKTDPGVAFDWPKYFSLLT